MNKLSALSKVFIHWSVVKSWQLSYLVIFRTQGTSGLISAGWPLFGGYEPEIRVCELRPNRMLKAKLNISNKNDRSENIVTTGNQFPERQNTRPSKRTDRKASCVCSLLATGMWTSRTGTNTSKTKKSLVWDDAMRCAGKALEFWWGRNLAAPRQE